MTTQQVRTRDFPALGFDPAPGELGSIAGMAERFTTVSTALGEAHESLTRIGRAGQVWQGQAAAAFRSTVGELPGYLELANTSLGRAATALDGWGTDLASLQRHAANLEAEAAAAQAEVQRAQANPDLGLGGQSFPDAESLRHAQQRLDAALGALNGAQAELEAIREQARRLLEQHDELARDIAETLRRARDEAPEEPGLFERLGETIGRALDEGLELLREDLEQLAEQTWQLIQDNANLIAAVSDVIGDLSTLIGTVGLALDVTGAGLPAGAVLGGVSAGLSAVALAGHGTAKAAGADVPTDTIAYDAIGVATLGIGRLGRVGADVAQLVGAGTTGAQLPGLFGNIQKYWVPKSPEQAALSAVSPAGVAFWNAIDQGHQKDLEARR